MAMLEAQGTADYCGLGGFLIHSEWIGIFRCTQVAKQ